MNKTSLKIMLSSIGIAIILALMATATYAYFTLEIEGKGSNMIINTFNKNMQITYTDTSNVTLVNAYTGETVSKTFTVKNTGDVAVYYNITLESVVNNFAKPEELVYTITETGGAANKTETVVPSTDSTILSDIKIDKGATHYYVMQITFLQKEYDQSYNMNKTFSSNINIVPSNNSGSLMKADRDTIGYAIINDFENRSVSTYSNNTNGYVFTNNSIDGEKNYLYTGSSNNNNALFGGFCWKIIRTNTLGNVRMIYNGTPTDGKCSTLNDTTVFINSSVFNDSSNYNAYVGYMYGSPNSTTYEDEHKNTNSSKIKTTLEEWYATNLLKYSDYIEDAIYCNNRKTYEFTINNVKYSTSGYGNLNTGYLSKYNDGIKEKPSLDCTNVNDRFTVSKKLNTYPIGLITADEAMFIGNKETTSTTTYLDNNNAYWTMTPAYFNGTNAYNYIIKGNNLKTLSTSTSAGVRPVITIKNSVKLLGGNGSESTPYIITK